MEKGDSYQINFTQPKQYQVSGNPFDLYMSMREYIQPYCGMYLNPGNMQILSFSPERFIRTSNGIIESFPMKGTRPRTEDLIQNKRLAGELYNSEKDKAEHLGIDTKASSGALELLIETGARPSELVDLKIENINLIGITLESLGTNFLPDTA